ncbi:MAG: hypothetical protein ACPGVP_21435 [Thiolinea sp.]
MTNKTTPTKKQQVQQQKREEGIHLILGGLIIEAAKDDKEIRTWLLQKVSEKITRVADKRRLESLLIDLRSRE